MRIQELKSILQLPADKFDSFYKNFTNENPRGMTADFLNYLHKHQLPPKLLIANKIQEKILLQDALTKTFNSKIRILTKVPKGGKSFLNLAKLNVF